MLSIIIPALEEEHYLGTLLACLRAQTYNDFEVIVVDAQSKDRTINVVKLFSKCFPLRVIISPVRNISVQRNIGASYAKDGLLLFFDSDVWIANTFLERAIKEFERRRLDIASCYLKPFSRGKRDRLLWLFFINAVLAICQFLYPGGVGACIICRPELHKKIGGFDSNIRLAEDFDYVHRAEKIGRYRVLNRAINISTRRVDVEGHMRVFLKYVYAGACRVSGRERYMRKATYNFAEYDSLHGNNKS